jgi:nucleoid-associated protein YgaU
MRSHRTSPGKSTLVERHYGGVQAKGADLAAGRQDDVHAAAKAGTSGAGGALPHLDTIQRAFGRHDVRGVSAHTDGNAAQASASMGAQAFAFGNRVAFGSSPDLFTAAHEAAHVVQQRAGVQLKGGVGQAGDPYEQHADAVAAKVVSGESAEALLDTMAGSGSAGGVQMSPAVQMIETYGGNWTTERYDPVSSGASRGCDIKLVFEPTELVRSPRIALTQTITMNKGGTPYFMGEDEREDRGNTAAQGDEGRHIDRLGERTSPLYGVNNDGTPSGTTQFGKRVVKPDGTVEKTNAFLEDEPKLNWAAGRPQAQTFETAAVSMEGTQANTYYGTVSWGVHTDGAGAVTLDPVAVVSMGAPTGDFMAATENWNAQEVDVGGTATATDDLPVTSHRTADPASLNDAQLEERMRTLCNEIRALDRTTPDYQNKRFEIRGLAREAVRRAGAAGRPVDSGHTRSVAAGDSLWSLAETHLGGGANWTRIFMLNYEELGDPNRIFAGATLKMPRPYTPREP